MFSVLFSYSLSLDYCKAPQTAPSKQDDMELKFISVLSDPGLLTSQKTYLPKDKLGTWKCHEDGNNGFKTRIAPSIQYRHYHQVLDPLYAEFPDNCRLDDITLQARKNTLDLGKVYRKYLVDDLKFLPEKLHPMYFRFFSAPDDASYLATQTFLNGLYPPKSDNEILTIETAADERSPLTISPKLCENLSTAYKSYKENETYKSFINGAKSKLEPALKAAGLDKEKADLASFCKFTLAMKCNEDSKLPSEFTDEVISTCQEVVKVEELEFYSNHSATAAAPILRHLLKYGDKALGQNTKVIANYQAVRNNAIAAICAICEYKGDVPLGSHLAFEIWRNTTDNVQHVRFSLNGKEIKNQRYDRFRVEIDPQIAAPCAEQNFFYEY